MTKSLQFFPLAVLVIFLHSPNVLFSADPPPERKAGDHMELTINDVKYAFRWCPPGTFTMGSPENEAGRYDNETPHQVTLSRGFWMQETEVTNRMWKSVMGNVPPSYNGTERPCPGTEFPADWVSWNESQEYITKLNALGIAPAGFKFSLPTEAQWEYACRAGTTTAYSFGATLNREQANVRDRDSSPMELTNVGSYPANTWGLRDMHGNVAEWCLGWYGDYPSGAVTDPMGASSDESPVAVARGGGRYLPAEFSRSAFRFHSSLSYKCLHYGCRLALVASE